MGPESPLLPGLLQTAPDPAAQSRFDPVRYAVQATLVLYLLPVIVLVAAIGLTSIMVGRSARLVAKAAAIMTGGSGRFAGRTLSPSRRVIGSRPILVPKKPKRSRIIR